MLSAFFTFGPEVKEAEERAERASTRADDDLQLRTRSRNDSLPASCFYGVRQA